MHSLSVLRIPALAASQVQMRLSRLPREGSFPPAWQIVPLNDNHDGWWEIDLRNVGLGDGAYEYEFVVNRNGGWFTAADPYAEEITRLSGYRGVFHIRGGARHRPYFSWDDELSGGSLPNNNEMVIYELPMRWVDAGSDGYSRQVGLGTFDKAIFERLEKSIHPLGVNCIELLPVQDSPDTLNWGYGTRFFFAPDLDMGATFELKQFVKCCHQSGIRVILDIVMNHARSCPLEKLAYDWFFLGSGYEEKDPNGDPRHDWGGKLFRYREQRGGAFHSRNFHIGVAEFLIEQFHVDGFRLDEFKGIDNYDFVQDFTDRAHQTHERFLPGRPFVVIAEDSWRRKEITAERHRGRRVVDSMWDFDFRDEVRRLFSNTLFTKWGEASRSQRVRDMLGAHRFGDMARRVAYCTSHDVEADMEQRLVEYFRSQCSLDEYTAYNQVVGVMALTLTAAGIPMFLAGEEFADLHDTNRRDWRQKMSDPIDWHRQGLLGHCGVLSRVRQLVHLRTSHAALHRNEIEFFGFSWTNRGFHPAFDENDGERLFAFCRAQGRPLGSDGQVIVVANCRNQDYAGIWIDWPWGYRTSLAEHGGKGLALPYVEGTGARLPIGAYDVRVFSV